MEREQDGDRADRAPAAERIRHQHRWVEMQVRTAVERGDFDDLPGLGKPIEGLGGDHDPDWWVKRLVERERLHLVPPAIALRTEDAELEARLDRLGSPEQVRRTVEDFNERVRHTLYSNPGGPPVLTAQRCVEAEVAAWQERRLARRAADQAQEQDPTAQRSGPRRWWPRRSG